MGSRRNIQELVQNAGVRPLFARDPCLTAPTRPNIFASEEDRNVVWNMLVEQRKAHPDYREPNKQLKHIFKSSKEKEKLQDPNRWEFTPAELDSALSSLISRNSTKPGLVQALLELGASVNLVDAAKKPKGIKRHNNGAGLNRSNTLQRAASMRRCDLVGILASAGADQETLDRGLGAALSANDQSSTEELLRHGADLSKFPDSLLNAVRSRDEKFLRLLLRAPKPVPEQVISASLVEGVEQKSLSIISLLVGYGADPNYDNASALNLAISRQEYQLAVAIAAGPIRFKDISLQSAFQIVQKMPNIEDVQLFVELLLCCGLPPDTRGVFQILTSAVKSSNASLLKLLVDYGVSVDFNGAEAFRIALYNSDWPIFNILMQGRVSVLSASIALTVVPRQAPWNERLSAIKSLVKRGVEGPPLGRWLITAVEDEDTALMSFLVNAGAPLDLDEHAALKTIVARKDISGIRALLAGNPSPESLARAFPLLRTGYTPSERLNMARLLLKHGARGVEIDKALIYAVMDTTTARDPDLIRELLQHGADVNFKGGKAIRLAVTHADMPVLRMLCGSKASIQTTSAALPLAFEQSGRRHSVTLPIIELLCAPGVLEEPAKETLRIAVSRGPRNLDIIHRIISAKTDLVESAFQFALSISNSEFKLPILTALLRIGVPQHSLDTALVTETQNSIRTSDGEGLEIVELLLDNGASMDSNDGEAVKMAVTARSGAVCHMLLNGKQPPSKPILTKAFRSLFQNLDFEQTSLAIGITRELLDKGIDQPAIDSTFRKTLSGQYWDRNTEELAELLLQYGANVNTADGTCFAFAAEKKDSHIFSKMLALKPDFSVVIPCLLMSKIEERSLVTALRLCLDQNQTSGIFDPSQRRGEPFLVTAIREYPRGEDLIKLLLGNGCNPNAAARCVLDSNVGEENVPAIIWALAQPQKSVSTGVITALISAGASVTRHTPKSEYTPLHIAAREGREKIVDELLAHGADASARDKLNYSPLFFASSMPVPAIVQSLCQSKALTNDGSLHEAARSLNVENATILLSYGHGSNFPCRLHGGRNALGELCLGVEVTNSSQRSKLRKMIRLLLNAGSNTKFRARNEKSVVHLALDNPHSSLEVAEALLETEIWEELNDDAHLYKDAAGLWYSPIKYVELVPHRGRDPYKQELLELLGDKGCEPRYYSETPEQPTGAVGLPAAIRRLADQHKEHMLKLELAKKTHDHHRMLEQTAHQDMLRRKKEQDDAEILSRTILHAKWEEIERAKHEFEMEKVRSAERMKRNERVATHNLIMEQESDAATRRLQIEDRKNQQALQYEARGIAQRQAELDYRVRSEQRLLADKEGAFERDVQRQKRIADRVDESAKLHAQLRQERPPQSPHSPLRIEQWGTVD